MVIYLVDRRYIGGKTGRYEISYHDDAAGQYRVDGLPAELLCHVFRIEDDGDHGKAVKMHSDLIAERYCAEAEINRYPEIDQTDINIETVFGNECITDDVYEKRRYAEP